MVHNGIEYGLMAAYAEGLGILRAANIGKQKQDDRRRDHAAARSGVLSVRLQPADVAEVWRRGSVIASWLLDLTAAALADDPALSKFAGRVSDSGEGRWTIKAAIDEGVPAPVLTAALYERFSSRGNAEFQDKLLSAMRYEFGGHLRRRRSSDATMQAREDTMTELDCDALVFFGATGRSRLQEDLPVAAGDGEARHLERSGHRRRRKRVGSSSS